MVRVHTFANGLTLAFESQPWLPSVSFELAVLAGAATEPEDVRGVSALLEEWVYRGAGGLNSHAFSEAVDDLGLRRSGGAGVEMSTFGGQCLALDLPRALELYASVVRKPHLEEQEFAPCLELAKQELAALHDDPPQRLMDTLRERFFISGHGRSPLGTAAGLAVLTPERARTDFTRRYGPNGAVLGVAGGIEWDVLLELTERLFADWSGESSVPDPVQMRENLYEHISEDTKQTQIALAYCDPTPVGNGPFGKGSEKTWFESRVALSVLSGAGFSSRLMREVRELRGLVYSVYAQGVRLRDGGYVYAYAGTTPERADETLAVIHGEFERLSEGISAEELERARIGLIANLMMSEESSSARAKALVRDLLSFGRVRTSGEIRSGLESVNLDSLNAFLANYPFVNPVVATLGPQPLNWRTN